MDTEIDDLLAELGAYLDEDGPRLSLPARAYLSPDLYELEQEVIFDRSWMMVGRSDQLAAPGDYLALTIGTDPIVVVRSSDGALRAMSSICRHRLMPVVGDGWGHVDRFTCPYHRWTYGLDGRLAHAPWMGDVTSFDRTACRLPPLAVEEWLGFVFVNPGSDTEPVASRLAGVAREVANYDLESYVRVALYDREWKANWKVLVENSSESYHNMGLHRESLDPLVPSRGTYGRQGGDWWSYHRTPRIPNTPLRTLPGLTEDDRAEAKLFRLFPTSALITAGEFVLWADFVPLAVDRTRVLTGVLFPPTRLALEEPEAFGRAHRRTLTVVEEEDRVAVERIQRAAASRHADRGSLSPKEPAVLDFYRYLARSLCG